MTLKAILNPGWGLTCCPEYKFFFIVLDACLAAKDLPFAVLISEEIRISRSLTPHALLAGIWEKRADMDSEMAHCTRSP